MSHILHLWCGFLHHVGPVDQTQAVSLYPPSHPAFETRSHSVNQLSSMLHQSCLSLLGRWITNAIHQVWPDSAKETPLFTICVSCPPPNIVSKLPSEKLLKFLLLMKL